MLDRIYGFFQQLSIKASRLSGPHSPVLPGTPTQARQGKGPAPLGWAQRCRGTHLEEVEERVVGRRGQISPLADQDFF